MGEHQRALAEERRRGRGHVDDAEGPRTAERMSGPERRLAEANDEIGRLHGRLKDVKSNYAAEKQAMLQQAELSRYRALEEERRKWEGHERRLEEQLQLARARGDKGVDPTTAARLVSAEEELGQKIAQLESSEALRRELHCE